MAIYDTIGKTYQNTRNADVRILSRIVALLNLPPGSQIADIGAGTGNYSVALAEVGYLIHAVEPSLVMQRQTRFHKDVHWLQGSAERVPLTNDSVDGVISTLAVCHFSDIQKAFTEMARITRTDSVVIFTFDYNVGKYTWMYEYFPFFWELFNTFPSSKQLSDMLGSAMSCTTKVEPFLLPPDIADGFAAAAWQQPQRYLQEEYRRNISSFIKADPDMVKQCVRKLVDDLSSGIWEKKYGSVMRLNALDAGYRFVYTCK